MVKTNTEKQVALLDILYELVNKATRYLRNILLKPYKEISLLSRGLCSNYNNLLQAYKEYNIIALYTRNITKSKYLKDLFISIKKQIKGWLNIIYQDAVQSLISSYIISNN